MSGQALISRRRALAGAAALVIAPRAWASDKPLLGDDGKETPTWRLPSQISLDAPGIVTIGGASPDVIVTEFFDYNCPWCKKSAQDIDGFVRKDREFRLRLVQNAILSLGSVQAAKVVLATQALAGDAKAYKLHVALLTRRGRVDETNALDEAARMKLDRAAIETRADSEDIRLTLKRHAAMASALGMEATPSFAINGVGVGGWPGAKTLARIAKAVRSCDALVC